MAFRSGVFTSTSVTVNGDGIPVGNKAITAADFAKRFYHIYGNGISLKPTSAFYVTPKSGLIATVAAGWGMMSGYDFEETTDYDITMTSSTSAQTLYIGVRLDVATGEFTGNHVAARTTFIAATDRVFAIIVIPANAVTLTTAMITDTRYSATYCGTIEAQRTALADLATEYETALETLTETCVPIHASTHAAGHSDAITPAAIGAASAIHASRHASGGADAVTPASIGAAELSGGVVKASQARSLVQMKQASFTLGADDAERTTLLASVSAIVVTIPADSTYDFPIGTSFNFIRWHTGAASFTVEAGIGWKAVDDNVTLTNYGSAALLIKLAANTWWLSCG